MADERELMNPISRRDLIKTAAAGFAGAALTVPSLDSGEVGIKGKQDISMQDDLFSPLSGKVTQNPVPPTLDLRDMVRRCLIARSLECMERAGRRRQESLQSGQVESYRKELRDAVRGFYGRLPVGKNAAPPQAARVSAFQKDGYRLENVLFDSFPGWQVNATVYVPLSYPPPFPAVVVPVGHSGKQFEDYQLPARLFARCGYLAVLFDPPGQASEKQPGNDHFTDGVRCYLVGETSSRYFVADALRCIDYLETRSDADLRRGVAMTGVSGGGTTTTLAGLLDDRITVMGPSCCLSPLSALDITQCYAGCPETHMWRRYAEGVDEVDLLCAAFPKPTLLMAGEADEVFRIEDTKRLAEEVRSFYKAGGVEASFEFFIDSAGHCYSLTQARRFVRFLNRWLLEEPDRPLPDLKDEDFQMDPYEHLRCSPLTDVNMRTLTLDRARELEQSRSSQAEQIHAAAGTVAGAKELPAAPKAGVGEPFPVWTHLWQQVLLLPEEGIELPATFLYPSKTPAATVLHFDDTGRNRHLYRSGPLTSAACFLDRDRAGFGVFSVDLRGWGDSSPAMYPYELAGWGGIDRCLAYMSAALGDPLMSMRIRDGLSSLSYLRSRKEADPTKIILSGSGLGGIVAMHVAAIDGKAAGTVIWSCLASFQSLLETEHYTWPADVFIPQALLHYDLPELAASLPEPVIILNPLDGAGQALHSSSLENLNRKAGRAMYCPDAAPQKIVESLQSLLDF